MENKYPQRTKNHQIGDIARDQLTSIFNQNGWTVEEIKRDYGEDLMVQVVIEEQVLPLRVYIQLKGTENLQRFKKKIIIHIQN